MTAKSNFFISSPTSMRFLAVLILRRQEQPFKSLERKYGRSLERACELFVDSTFTFRMTWCQWWVQNSNCGGSNSFYIPN
jgi:hypothetical protein